jgi:glucosamine 6-phosphate synthetase-like amidotransferase/phosphosugar isomerase protein
MNELMLQEMASQAEMLSDGIRGLRHQAARLAVPSMNRIVLTGSGDSGYAALAVAGLYWVRLSVPAVALPSMESARYPKSSHGDLTIAISVSGEVVRTVEAARVARARGSATVAVVASAESTLARDCESVLVMPKPITRTTPHTRDYTATLLALGVLGERLSGSIWPDLDQWVGSVGSIVEESLVWAAQLSAPPSDTRVWFLGSGPDRGTAAYGALKFWEGGGALSWWDDLEEFAHGSQLQARPGDDVVLLATGRTRSRAVEMVPGLLRMETRPIAITDGELLPGLPAHQQFKLPAIQNDAMIGFYSCVPVQAIAYAYASTRGVDVLKPMGGARFGQTYEDVHNEWMRKSQVET